MKKPGWDVRRNVDWRVPELQLVKNGGAVNPSSKIVDSLISPLPRREPERLQNLCPDDEEGQRGRQYFPQHGP
jgi:hypothetical protein